jgi:hypothetical protein
MCGASNLPNYVWRLPVVPGYGFCHDSIILLWTADIGRDGGETLLRRVFGGSL